MAEAARSVFFAVGSLVAIFALVLAVLRRYISLRANPAYLSLSVFLGLALPASVVLLVPIDLSSSNFDGDSPYGIWLPSRVLLVSWRIAYWLTFILTWILLPVIGEYVDSGYRTPYDKFVYSLRSNGQFYLLMLACCLVGLVYIIIQNGFAVTSLKSLVMALAYVSGLIFAIYLMGHGLVAIPRSFWRDADTGNRLRRLQARATRIHDRLTDSMAELEDVEYQVNQLEKRKLTVSPDQRDWIEELTEVANMPASRLALTVPPGTSRSNPPAVVTERYLAELGRRLNRARHQNARFSDTWARLVQEAADCQAIINSHASQRLEFRSSPHTYNINGPSAFGARFMTPYLRYLLHAHVLPAVRILLAGVFAVASVCIVWSEVIKSFFPVLSIIPYTVIRTRDDVEVVNFFGQLMASGWILYMCYAAFTGINDAKVWGNRALVPRNTYPESACWYSTQVAKLTVPLAYNFLTFLPANPQNNTTFHDFLGRLINLTPLGKGFDYFFPICVLFPACATLFNLYGRVKRIFDPGLDGDDEDLEGNPSGMGAGGWREGRSLIDSELNGPGFLGLSSRSGGTGTGDARGSPSLSTPPSRQRPTVWVPPAQDSTAAGTTAAAASAASQSRPRASRTANLSDTGDDDDEEDAGNVFQNFAHRVKNTFETAPRPKWLQGGGEGGGDSGIKRPRWMGS